MATTPVFLSGESLWQRSLVGYSPWGHKELDTTEHMLDRYLLGINLCWALCWAVASQQGPERTWLLSCKGEVTDRLRSHTSVIKKGWRLHCNSNNQKVFSKKSGGLKRTWRMKISWVCFFFFSIIQSQLPEPRGLPLVGQMVKNLPEMQETWVRSLGREDPLEKGMATRSSILVWKIPWTEETGGLQPMRSQTVGLDWVTNTPQPEPRVGNCTLPHKRVGANSSSSVQQQNTRISNLVTEIRLGMWI